MPNNEGKKFENDIKSSIPESCYYLRLNDPAQSFNKANDGLRFSLHNPYDTLLFDGEKLFCFEMKTTLGSLTYWKEGFEDKDKQSSFNIKKNQVIGLRIASQYKNVIAGFILNFRKVNQTYFLSIKQFDEMINKLDKKSFNLDDVIQIGAILISQTLKKTRYRYDIEELINDLG